MTEKNSPAENLIDSNEADLLVIDDEPMMAKVIARFMNRHFRKVFTTYRTDEGLSIINEELSPNSTVISDYHNEPCPDLSGLELARLTKNVRQTKQIPFHLISGGFVGKTGARDESELQSLIKDSTIDSFTSKPMVIPELVKAIMTKYKPKA